MSDRVTQQQARERGKESRQQFKQQLCQSNKTTKDKPSVKLEASIKIDKTLRIILSMKVATNNKNEQDHECKLPLNVPIIIGTRTMSPERHR